MNKGTPKTLDQAISNAFTIEGLGDESHAYNTIKDFMAQKFTVYYLKKADNQEVMDVLFELYEKLTKREV